MIESIENGRKEDGNRSIADKIIKRLHDLEKTVENNQGRWAWELLQNAKDSVADMPGRSVSVQLEFNESYVEFKHNGPPFTEQDIRGLINQISSKEIEEGEQTKKTGRFGTGFLTTHLLSKTIQIGGVVHTNDQQHYSFQFPLDRQGKTTHDLVPKIENAWTQFHQSVRKITNATENTFSTSFGYPLETEDQKNIAKIGIDEFVRLLPFVLTFIPVIESVEIIHNPSARTVKFQNTKQVVDGFIKPISKIKGNHTEIIPMGVIRGQKADIAIQLKKLENGYAVVNHNDVPKLFCDFPLIGTEKFHFPLVVNSFYFHPQTERDGVWLKGRKDGSDQEANENQEIMVEAKSLFESLLENVTKAAFFDLYNLAQTEMPEVDEKYFDKEWFKEYVQRPIRDKLFESPIVEIENDIEKKPLKSVYFPMRSYGEDLQVQLWEYIFDLHPTSVCKKQHLINWTNVYWEECNKIGYSTLAGSIAKFESLEKLGEKLNLNYDGTIKWLNSVCDFIYKDESNLSLFEKNALAPNQNGILLKKDELFIDEIDDHDLVEILRLLGEDWKSILLDKNVSYGRYQVKKKKDIADKITERLRNPKDTEESKKAIVLLSEWFETHNPDDCRNLFSDPYKNRAELFMNTVSDKESLYKVMRSGTDLSELSRIAQTLAANPQLAGDILGAAQLSTLFQEFNITSIDELKNILRERSGSQSFGEGILFTPEVLASLGVTSPEELENALRDKDLAALFNHTSTPNTAMFAYAQGLISRAKNNVLSHLKTLPDYNCNEMEELATTVIGGIKKDGLAIHVVIRPSDFGEVIVYYSSEKDTLDYENAELWIDNGKDSPRLLTLGKILKDTGINKIPVI